MMRALSRLWLKRIALACAPWLFSACVAVTRPLAEWKPLGTAPGPWSGPGERAVLETRDFYVVAGFHQHDERWRGARGSTVDAWKVCERLVDLLAQTGELARWPETQAGNHKGVMRLGPYRIHLVSVFPDIAILVPHDYGSLRRSISELVGEADNTLGDPRIMNHIYYGTGIPGRGQVYWLSADLKQPLTPAAMNADGGFSIARRDVQLVGKPAGDGFALERLK